MNEAIELIESKLREVRNQTVGIEDRIEALEQKVANEKIVLESCSRREANLMVALDKLKHG